MKIKIILIVILIIVFVSGTIFFKPIKSVYNFYRLNSDVDFYFDNNGVKVTFQSDGLTIAGTLYGFEENDDIIRPGVIIVHGETRLGRELPIYKILAKKLVEKGYIVLTYDRRGIGESDTPQRIDLASSWDEGNDASQAVLFIYSLKNVDKSKIYAIGHSGGARPVMQVGLEDKRIKKIVLIGPSRRIEERILNKDAPDREYFWKRNSLNRGLEEPMPLDTFLSTVSQYKMLYNKYKVSDHIPIFLIDGELESYEDKLYLRNYFDELGEPKKYYTVNDSDHYLNTTSKSNFILYNSKVIDETVNAIDNWFTLE